jgi:outer membrane receptor for ferric coprogen and ferric-rhodotorulic acid
VELTPLGEIIPPVFGEGYEYGFRFDLLDGKLNGQITAFYIEKEKRYDRELRLASPRGLPCLAIWRNTSTDLQQPDV